MESNSPTALFDSYEQDFRQFIDTIREKLEGDGKDERNGEFTILHWKEVCLILSRTASSGLEES